MFHTPDIETLRLCSVLASLAFGTVFGWVWLDGRREHYLLHWAASSFLYALVLVALGMVKGDLVGRTVFLALLAVSDILLITGVRAFDREPPFRWWMIPPILAAPVLHLLPALLDVSPALHKSLGQIGDTIGIGASMLVAAIAILRPGTRPSRGRRIAGLALAGYMPGYAITLATQLFALPRVDMLALVPMLADQLLLGILNLGLLAMPNERAQERLRNAAMRDPLTGTWNRAGLEARMRRLVAPGTTVLAIDIDRFKAINDRHGHGAGDEVLIALARRITALVGRHGGEVARLGGDEFAAVIPTPLAADSSGLAEELRQACRQAQAGLPAWTISVGVSRVAIGDTDLADALKRADQALYRAKAAGRDRMAA